MDPTTLNRNLKPLLAKGMVKNAIDPADGRIRIVRVTEKGLGTLREAYRAGATRRRTSRKRSVRNRRPNSIGSLISRRPNCARALKARP